VEQTVTLAPTLQDRVLNRQRLAADIAKLKTEMDDESEAIKNEMMRLGLETLTDIPGWTPTLSVRERSTLDKTELISQGVSTAQIKAATKTSTYTQLDVREKKG